MKRTAQYVLAEMRNGVQHELQYRMAAYFLLIGFLIEPVVYLVVWRSVAESQGGAIGGYTADAFSAYYIVWTLVRAMNLALTPYVWDWRQQQGRLSEFLIRPVHPFFRDFGFFAGGKLVYIVFWIPIAAVLFATFRPSISPTLLQVVVFAIAIWGGFAIRFLALFVMGMVSFWTTRASALFEIIIAGELLLSGRLVPLSVMPSWVESIAAWLPFKWMFQYPIEAVIGRLSDAELIAGLGMQALWTAILGVSVFFAWRAAIKHYVAAGA